MHTNVAYCIATLSRPTSLFDPPRCERTATNLSGRLRDRTAVGRPERLYRHQSRLSARESAYAAPEQLMGEDIDGRADEYALAATVFQFRQRARRRTIIPIQLWSSAST